MIKVALKGLAGRKVRALLTALAVVIGVSMVSGTFVLTDTMQKAFDGIFTESYEGTDAVVSGRQLVDFSSGGRATVPAALLDEGQGRSRPSRPPSGSLIDLQNNSNAAKLLDQHGQDHRPRGRDARRRRRRDRPPVLPAQAQAGRVGARRRRDRARRRHRVQAALQGRRHRSARPATGPRSPTSSPASRQFGSVDSIGGASIAVFDLPTAQALFEKQGQFDIDLGQGQGGRHARRAGEGDQAAAARDAPRSRPATPRPRPTPRTPTRA